jgi:hypothetical protein
VKVKRTSTGLDVQPRSVVGCGLDGCPKACATTGAYPGGDGWQMHINGSHEFGIVVGHITLTGAIAELEAAGFGEVQAWSGNDGAVLKPGYFTRPVWYFHFMCVKQG